MNNYRKGRNENEEWKKHSLPIPNLPKDFIWMTVSGGSRIRDLLRVAFEKFEAEKHIVWSGSGSAVCKVITCAEITKRKFRNLKQYNHICFKRDKEYWDPKIEELDQLVVTRDCPAIHILLSKPEQDNEV